jgi:aspartate/methionine/tyrosine aminotransferase
MLLLSAGVAALGGSAFGPAGRSHLRIVDQTRPALAAYPRGLMR